MQPTLSAYMNVQLLRLGIDSRKVLYSRGSESFIGGEKLMGATESRLDTCDHQSVKPSIIQERECLIIRNY